MTRPLYQQSADTRLVGLERRLAALERRPSSAGVNPNLLFTVVLTTSTPSVTIPNIPQTWRDLQLIASARSDRGSEPDALGFQFNGDTGNNYDWQQISWPTDAVAVSLASAFAQPTGWIGEISVSATAANNFGTVQGLLSGYSQTGKYKNVMGQFNDNKYPTTVQVAGITGSTWHNTAAVTSITIRPVAGANLVAGTQISLYGV